MLKSIGRERAVNFAKISAVFLFIVIFFFSPAAQAQELQPFDGIYNFCWIGAEDQKNLNVGSSDFLIEFKANPVKITRANLPDIGIVAKKPMGSQPGYIVAITPSHDLAIYVNGVEREKRGKDDLRLIMGKYFNPGTWSHTAILIQPSKMRVTVFTNGKAVRTFDSIEMGNLDNWSEFTVGSANLGNHIRFKGQIAYAGVYKFAKGTPADVESLIATMSAGEDRSRFASMDGVKYSFWKLAKSDKGAEDLGNNGNFLWYMPENEKLRFAEAEKTFTPTSPKTLYVEARNPAANDDGSGTAARPFKSIGRAAAFAEAGDTVIVKKGLYRESLIPSGGRRGAPIRIKAEEGAVISGAEALKDWQKADAEGAYVIRGWKGTFAAGDPTQTDARKNPGTLVFVNGVPLDWVEYVEDLIPGTYTVWPREKGKPMDIYAFPLPGDNPERSPCEISTQGGVRLIDFVELEGFKFSIASAGFDGEGCVLKNNTIEWGNIGIYGSNHKIIGNKILWGPNQCMAAGGATGCLIEDNYLAYGNWRLFDINWGGGGSKLIPSNLDLTIRKNTYVYSWGCGLWFDSFNTGNTVEYNIMHDNAGHGGYFDEISWGNTVQYNVIYNNWCTRQNRSGGHGITIAGTGADAIYRSIVFNNERGDGVSISARESDGDVAGIIELSLKYPHHYVSYERQRKWLDEFVNNFKGKTVLQKDIKFHENISFNNLDCQLSTARDYRKKNDPMAQFYDFESDGNIFFNTKQPAKIIQMQNESLTLQQWQEISGKDKNSQILDPYKQTDKLPQWARELLDFSKHKFRLASEIAELNPDIRDGVGTMVFKERIARSSSYRKLKVQDPTLRAFVIDVEGQKMLALWRSFGAGMVRVNVSSGQLTYEDRWFRTKPVEAQDGKAVVFVGQDPVYLIGIPDDAAIDPTFKAKLYGTAKEVSIAFTPSKPKIDGNLSDWAAIKTRGAIAELDSDRGVIPDSTRKWEGPKDCSAKVYAAWDQAGLYFAFDVTNDSISAGDSVELFIDGREEWKQFFTEYQPGVYHLKLEPSADGKLKISTPAMTRGTFYSKGKAAPTGVEGACAVKGAGYTIELFIPWNKQNFPGVTLAKGIVVRAGMLLNDADAGKTGSLTMKWNAHRSNDSESSGWLPVSMR